MRCPQCGHDKIEIVNSQNVRLNYKESPTKVEIKNGTIKCAKCETNFLIKDFILSFIKQTPVNSEIIAEGEYWGKYYQNLFCRNILNYVDVREPHVPLFPFFRWLLRGPETVPWEKRITLRQKVGGLPVRLFQNDEYEELLNNEYLIKESIFGSKVLEVGCGSGWLSLELKRKGYSVIGIDPSFEALRVAKSYAIAKGTYIEYVQSDVILPIFKENVFDNIFAFHALHHAQDFERTLSNIKNWLKMNGLFIVYDHRRRTIKPLEIINYIMDLPFLAILNFRFKNTAEHIVAIVFSSSPSEDASANSVGLIENYFHIIHKVCFSHFLSNFPRTIFLAFKMKNPAVIISLARLSTIMQQMAKAISVNNCEFVFYIARNKKALQEFNF